MQILLRGRRRDPRPAGRGKAHPFDEMRSPRVLADFTARRLRTDLPHRRSRSCPCSLPRWWKENAGAVQPVSPVTSERLWAVKPCSRSPGSASWAGASGARPGGQHEQPGVSFRCREEQMHKAGKDLLKDFPKASRIAGESTSLRRWAPHGGPPLRG